MSTLPCGRIATLVSATLAIWASRSTSAASWYTASPIMARGCGDASPMTRTARPCPPHDCLGVSPSRCWRRQALLLWGRGSQLRFPSGGAVELSHGGLGLHMLSAALRHVLERSANPYVFQAVHSAATAGANRANMRREKRPRSGAPSSGSCWPRTLQWTRYVADHLAEAEAEGGGPAHVTYRAGCPRRCSIFSLPINTRLSAS